jgi:hypothetical protein
MRCEEARALLQVYVDRELPSERQEEVGEHLRACAECAREEERIVHLVALLQGQPMLAPQRDLVPEVIAKVKAARTLALRRMVAQIAAVAASVLLAVLVTYFVLSRPHPATSVPLTAKKPSVSAQAPDIDVALSNLWDSFSSVWGVIPDYSGDVVNGVQWLTGPITAYITETLAPELEKVSLPSLG